jgi:hypothetical protein
MVRRVYLGQNFELRKEMEFLGKWSVFSLKSDQYSTFFLLFTKNYSLKKTTPQ